jgi:hypothetical protein
MQPEFHYNLATEQELNDLISGKEVGTSLPWPGFSMSYSLPIGKTGVLWKRRSIDVVHPLALIAREEDFKRLCGRFAQLRSDLSPLTAWCHLLSFEQFKLLQSPSESNLVGWEAAWTGLVIAEAQLSAEKPLRDISFTACLATESFAVARTRGLWGELSEYDISTRFDAANRFLRGKNGNDPWNARTMKVRQALRPIWLALSALLRGGTRSHDRESRLLVESLMALEGARSQNDVNEAEKFVRPLLSVVPEAEALVSLPKLAPEQRLNLFDRIVSQRRSHSIQDFRYQALGFIAGYLTTIAAGGTPTLTLAENVASSWPEVTGWAYVIGGIGERVTWTSGFDGLGRLVSRELSRPFRVEEPPICDCSLDEALVLVDAALPDPLVHLRIKQNRVATVALLPGVNILIPLNGVVKSESKRQQSSESMRPIESGKVNRDLALAIADVIWPLLRPRVDECIKLSQDTEFYESDRRSRNKQRTSSQMPLKRAKD